MKALGLVVSDKIFEICKTYFLTLWPTYPNNQNHLNNYGRVKIQWVVSEEKMFK